MAESYPHLPLEREAPVTERRPRRSWFGGTPPEDPLDHARGLRARLDQASEQAAADEVGLYTLRIWSM